MIRVRNNNNRWRRKWPWRVLFPLKVNERVCPKCDMPYHKGLLPEPVKRYRHNTVEGWVYPAGTLVRDEFVVRFGRWAEVPQGMFLSEFIPEDYLEALQTVVSQAREDYLTRTRARGGRQ